ncbi:unnamed protein product [Clonostachys rosea f. rosea IK726]|uniref:Uncharacterized protein n=1 Tax=Clonostachys rosea f. rosea IK726 TaxID=1349383 RepID=A0ACA9TX71_BIOOC|nr:unnamed protein product [Clonostachys rosea f. rosea IK726]
MATRPATMKERRIWALETLQMCYPDKHHEYELELDWHGRADPLKYFPSDHFIFDKDLLLEEDNFFTPETTPAPETPLPSKKRVTFEDWVEPEVQPSFQPPKRPSPVVDDPNDSDGGFVPSSSSSSPLSSLGSKSPSLEPPPSQTEEEKRAARVAAWYPPPGVRALEDRGPTGILWPCDHCMRAVAHGRGIPICQSAGGKARRCSHCISNGRECKSGPSHCRPLFHQASVAFHTGDQKLYQRIKAALRLHLELEDSQPGWFSAGRRDEEDMVARREKVLALADEIKKAYE